jgi:hypothetical protein
MPMSPKDRVIGIALSNPKFRKQLLDPNVDNKDLLKEYGITPTPDLVSMDKEKMLSEIKKKLGQTAWCIGNACGVGA